MPPTSALHIRSAFHLPIFDYLFREIIMQRVTLGLCLTALLGAMAVSAPLDTADAQTTEIDRIIAAVRNRPRPVAITGAGDYAYYQLKIENLCGAGSITEAATAWVDGQTFTDRAVAMSVT